MLACFASTRRPRLVIERLAFDMTGLGDQLAVQVRRSAM
jgi:hypothetical protein